MKKQVNIKSVMRSNIHQAIGIKNEDAKLLVARSQSSVASPVLAMT
jgi:hypothetical protein